MSHEIRFVIYKRRLVLEMTQKTLAEKAGISQSTVCKTEAGRHDIAWSVAVRILNALGLEIKIVGKEADQDSFANNPFE